jgi:hypothetical protein
MVLDTKEKIEKYILKKENVHPRRQATVIWPCYGTRRHISLSGCLQVMAEGKNPCIGIIINLV